MSVAYIPLELNVSINFVYKAFTFRNHASTPHVSLQAHFYQLPKALRSKVSSWMC